jgi:SlyX protein
MSDERLVDIETKLAHQDHLLIELNDVITNQQDRIMKLEELCSSLVERVRSIGDSMPGEASQEDPPPHY